MIIGITALIITIMHSAVHVLQGEECESPSEGLKLCIEHFRLLGIFFPYHVCSGLRCVPMILARLSPSPHPMCSVLIEQQALWLL